MSQHDGAGLVSKYPWFTEPGFVIEKRIQLLPGHWCERCFFKDDAEFRVNHGAVVIYLCPTCLSALPSVDQ